MALWHSIRGFWRRQLEDLGTDRARVILVVLGVVWGTLSLSIVLGFGQGFAQAMGKAIASSGPDLLRISAGSTTRPFGGLPAGRPIYLSPEDAAAVAAQVPGLHSTSIEYSRGGNPLVYGGTRHNVRLIGVEPAYGRLRSFAPQAGGRFLKELDLAQRRRVVFLGNRLKQRIFGRREAVGQTVRLHGQPFLVIGVMQPKTPLGNYNGRDRDKAVIPASTFAGMLGYRSISFLLAGVSQPAEAGSVLRAIYRCLGSRLRFDPRDRPAIDVQNQVRNMEDATFMVGGIIILMVLVAGLGMLVALVGVANVMYVMVEERRKEFGILMALGARPRQIAAGRLVEGAVITSLGALLGVGLSFGLLQLLNLIPLDADARGYLGSPLLSPFTALAIALSLGIAGAVAGYLPARHAARIQPVEALHDD